MAYIKPMRTLCHAQGSALTTLCHAHDDIEVNEIVVVVLNIVSGEEEGHYHYSIMSVENQKGAFTVTVYNVHGGGPS